MAQTFECPNCHAPLAYDAARAAAAVRCEYCGSTVIVPDSLRESRRQPAGGMDQAFVLAEAAQLVQNGRKIEAIKRVREAFGMGLKDAKDVVDAIERHETVHLGGMSVGAVHKEAPLYPTPSAPAQKGRGCGWAIVLMVVVVFIGIGVASFLIVSRAETSVSSGETVRLGEVVEQVLDGTAVSIESVRSTIAPEVTATPAFARVVQQFGGEEGIGPGFFNDTRRLAVDGAGHIYVGDYSNGRIQVFDADGTFLSQMNVGDDVYMVAMTVDRNGIVYVSYRQQILRFDGATGAALDPLPYQINVRTMTTAPDGSVIIVAEDRLLRLDAQGNVTLDVREPFAEIPDFATTHEDVAVDGAGNMYVLGSETIYKLNGNGRFITRIGSQGDADDQFMTSPTSLAVDGQGRIYADDFWGVKVFDGNGRYLDIIPMQGVAFDMLVTTKNQLLVMDRNGNRVLTYEINE